MEKIIGDYLSSIELGDMQQHKNMAVFPLFTSLNHGPEYLTLKEALALGVLAITEITEGGSVPNLKAINKGDLPILLLDGEELAGAKQNRALNTTILLKEHSETVIPVSCTEQGRWSYRSSEFADSDVIMAQKLRYKNVRTVADNLRSSREFRSNQGEVWDHVAEMQQDAGVHSSTNAMKDVYESRQDDLDEYLRAFPHLPRQRGILVFINGKATGLDMVSRESACATLNPKLVKSYAIDAHLEMRSKEKGYEISPDKALRFLKKASGCKEERYESIGHGIDYRFQGETIVGSALVYRDTVIHTAFFRATESERTERMAGYKRRRGHRL
jgi:hypothetical protein